MAIGIRAFGSTGSSPFTVTLRSDSESPAVAQMVTRSLWFDQDIDGTWLVWAADPLERDSMPPAVGSIAVRDAAVAAFLEALGHLLAFPGRFEYEPRFNGSLRWMRVLARVTPVRPPPMTTLLDDVPIRFMRQERTTMVGRDP